MRQMQKVLWTKGALLTPQHLQLQDRFIEDLISFQVSALTPAAFGFTALEIDREALDDGLLSLSSASGVFPDGLLFDAPRADPSPPDRPLEDIWQPDQQALTAYLAVAEYRAGGRNVSVGGRDRDARFSAEVTFRRDENTGQTEKPVEVARKNFRWAFEGESLDGSSVIPAARILQAPAGGFELDPRFVPPLLDIGASPHLMTITRRLVELLSARSHDLAGTRRQRGQGLADFGISDVANFWLLYTTNTYLPVFRHILEVRRGHPLILFQAMLALAGALTTFSSRLSPGDLPQYAHSDLTTCIAELDRSIRELLETVVPASYVSLPLKPLSPYVHATRIDDDSYLAADGYYLAVKADGDRTRLRDDVPRLVKVGSAERVDQAKGAGLGGLDVEAVDDPPKEIPVKLDHLYFRLHAAGEDWAEIVRTRTLAAYVPAAIRKASLELLILIPPA